MARRKKRGIMDYVTLPIKLLILPSILIYQTIDSKVREPIRNFMERRNLPGKYKKLLEKHGLGTARTEFFIGMYSKKGSDLEEKLLQIKEDYIASSN